MNSPEHRKLPSVDRVLQALAPGGLGLPRSIVVAIIRRELDRVRETPDLDVPALAVLLARVREGIERLRHQRIQPVVNGTGVVIHTNLGRAPLGIPAAEALRAVALNYSNLEYDLVEGTRGSRGGYVEQNLARLCSAEAATVVNNCAAALVLILRHVTQRADRREVVISRGELIQIGGGFRIPDILEATGARLREVGTTNHTTVADYSAAVGDATALILRVHRSNFFLGGFTSSPAAQELTALGKRAGVPVVEDLGSGALLPTERLPEKAEGTVVRHERTPQEALRDGVDLVCFSGDKLLGGPQAGIVVGRSNLVEALKKQPFFRALRCDKLVLAALQATVDLYLEGSLDAVPVLRLLRTGREELRARAEKIRSALAGYPVGISVGEGKAEVGGGTLPGAEIASVTLHLTPRDYPAAELAARLRTADPPVVGYVAKGRCQIDLRTVFPDQDALVIRALRAALTKSPGETAGAPEKPPAST
ncbi:MAG: L-seryl-tRNA(Sec) selenium transferase [Verrucomicrobia bacterium]|nr:L-seryl-tRNA(Sec) selenium transferase [Verrucomicrobiota bacterium]